MDSVLVVPRERLFPDCYPQGFEPFGGGASLSAFEEAVARHGFFVERDHAERTPSLKQVIPYTVIVCGGEVLLLRRLKTGGEGRLHGKLSIGVGGHVEPQDARSGEDRGRRLARAIAEGARRELAEELDVAGATELRPLGLINDDSNPVGAVHVGLAQLLTVDGTVRIREDHVLEGELVHPNRLVTLRADGANFETWSSLLVDRLDEIVPTRRATPRAPEGATQSTNA